MQLDIIIVTALSVLVQAAAVVLALKLIGVTGRRTAWILIALGISGMALRRVASLVHTVWASSFPSAEPYEFFYEALGLVISVFILAGIARIGPLFRAVRDSEDALRRSEERYRTMIDTAQEGIWILDVAGKTRLVNRRLAEMLGYEEEELVGRPPSEFMDADAASDFRRHFQERERGVAGDYDIRLRRKDGGALWAIVSGTPIFEDGRFAGAFGMLNDITDRKRLEEERERLIRDLRESAANVKTLSGLLPICSSCKKIRDDKGYWNQLEGYIRDHSGAEFTHGLCPDCLKRYLADRGD